MKEPAEYIFLGNYLSRGRDKYKRVSGGIKKIASLFEITMYGSFSAKTFDYGFVILRI